MTAYAYRSVPYYRETFDRLGLSPDDFRSGRRPRPAADPRARRHPARSRVLLLDRAPARGPAEDQQQRQLRRAAHRLSRPPRHLPERGAGRARTLDLDRADRPQDRLPRAGRSSRPTARSSRSSSTCGSTGSTRAGSASSAGTFSLHAQPDEAVRLVNDFKPDVIHSYGSYLAILFGHLAATGEAFHRPAALTYTSDGLSDSGRRLIAERFGLPVFRPTRRSRRSRSASSAAAPRRAPEPRPVPAADRRRRGPDAPRRRERRGRSSPTSSTAAACCSTTAGRHRRAAAGRLAVRPDDADASFPQGRGDDLIELDSGQIVHPQMIRTLFNPEGEIWEFQVVQQDDELVPGLAAGRAALRPGGHARARGRRSSRSCWARRPAPRSCSSTPSIARRAASSGR